MVRALCGWLADVLLRQCEYAGREVSAAACVRAAHACGICIAICGAQSCPQRKYLGFCSLYALTFHSRSF